MSYNEEKASLLRKKIAKAQRAIEAWRRRISECEHAIRKLRTYTEWELTEDWYSGVGFQIEWPHATKDGLQTLFEEEVSKSLRNGKLKICRKGTRFWMCEAGDLYMSKDDNAPHLSWYQKEAKDMKKFLVPVT